MNKASRRDAIAAMAGALLLVRNALCGGTRTFDAGQFVRIGGLDQWISIQGRGSGAESQSANEGLCGNTRRSLRLLHESAGLSTGAEAARCAALLVGRRKGLGGSAVATIGPDSDL